MSSQTPKLAAALADLDDRQSAEFLYGVLTSCVADIRAAGASETALQTALLSIAMRAIYDGSGPDELVRLTGGVALQIADLGDAAADLDLLYGQAVGSA